MQERLCLAQISNTLLKQFSYNEIHNRRVALGITCVQCTPVQLEILRRAGAMPVSSRRCGMITRREAERLCKSFLGDNAPPRLPDDFAFSVHHECAWGCCGSFLPARYNSSRAKCIKCSYCGLFFSPNKFIFHSHRVAPGDKYVQPDAANFNSWRRHMRLSGSPPEEVTHAWEDVKAMFNGGTRKRMMSASPPGMTKLDQSSVVSPTKRTKETPSLAASASASLVTPTPVAPPSNHAMMSGGSVAVTQSTQQQHHQLPFARSFMMDYMWHNAQSTAAAAAAAAAKHQATFSFPTYALPWLKPSGAGTGSRFLFNNNNNNNPTSNNNESAPTEVDAKPPVPLLQSLYSHSAFKPVVHHHSANATSSSSSSSQSTTNPSQITTTTSNGLLLRHPSLANSQHQHSHQVCINTYFVLFFL